MNVNAPRFMIAAPSSGSGKTVITCGIIKLLQDKGFAVQSFKCGPDYIDPLFHNQILEIPSYNLDTYFTSEELTKSLFAEKVCEFKDNSPISVVEGVMGFYDGIAGKEITASSSHLANVLDIPVILVVDARGMSRSVVALIKGFCDYDKSSSIKAVILNRVSAMMFPTLKSMIEEETGLVVLGYVPFTEDCEWQSRHLGLVLPEEIGDVRGKISSLAKTLSSTIDIDALLSLATSAKDIETKTVDEVISCTSMAGLAGKAIKLAVARDEAFCFYYEDNFRLLKKLGAQIEFFSPLHDNDIPLCDGLILGGGYPELYGRQLENNISMRMSVKTAVQSGVPVLAECGGFMYLQEKLKDKDGITYKMSGAIEGESFYTNKLVRFGYAEFSSDSLTIRGHEFHYFDSTNNGTAFSAQKPSSLKNWHCIVQRDNITAGFPHLYYYSCPEFAMEFLKKCKDFASTKKDNPSSFFENRECQYYPCHDIKECNCLFCYCPLYSRNPCPGTPTYIKKDDGRIIKRCTDCIYPHKRDNYSRIMRLLRVSPPSVSLQDFHHGGEESTCNMLDFSVNTNPLGMPEYVKRVLKNDVDSFARYPDRNCTELISLMADKWYGSNVSTEMIIAGNGASELIDLAVRAIAPKSALLCAPSFSGYEKALVNCNAQIEYYNLTEQKGFALDDDYFIQLAKKPDLVFLCNPNNPTGVCIDINILDSIAKYCESNGIFMIVDECFLSFVNEADKKTFVYKLKDYPHVLVINAFTKIYAMAGIRLGCALSANSMLINKMKHLQPEWSVSAIAQECGIACIENHIEDAEYRRLTKDTVNEERDFLTEQLEQLDCKVVNGEANFLLVKTPVPIHEKLLKENILVRNCDNFYGLDDFYIRIAVKKHEDNLRLIQALRNVL